MQHQQILQYVQFFDRMLSNAMPELFHHLKALHLGPDIYLLDWLMTIFCKSLPLDVASRIWDCFLVEGEIFIVVAAIGVLHLLSPQLVGRSFEQCMSRLTNLPADLSADELFAHINAVRIPEQAPRLLRQMLSFW
jgi:TBC1 domain family member 14